MKMTESQKVAAAAWRIRRYALQMGEVQGQGYIGQALGYADVLATAFSHAMTYRPKTLSGKGATASCFLTAITLSPTMRRCWKRELSRKRSWKPTVPTTAACRCRGWRPTRRGWRCPVVRWGRGCPLP